MNFTKDRAKVCKTCTYGDKLKVERILFWLIQNSFLIHRFMSHFFGFSIIVQNNCRLAGLIKTNRKPIQNHQSKTMLLFKAYTLEFEFDKHLVHMVSYQLMQCGLPVFFLLVNSTLQRFLSKNDCSVKPDFSYFSNYKHQNRSYFDRISSHLLISNQLYFDSGLFMKLKT